MKIESKFQICVLDCPWSYYNSEADSKTANGSVLNHYNTLSQKDLCNLPIKNILAKDALVFVWATSSKLHYAIECIEKWGLHFRGVAYVWIKTKQTGEIINGQGVPPTYTKPTTEYLLLATQKPQGRPIPIKRYNQAQVVLSPRGKHSEKPEIFYDMIDEMVDSNLLKIDIFARRHREGWTCVGDALQPGFDIREVI